MGITIKKKDAKHGILKIHYGERIVVNKMLRLGERVEQQRESLDVYRSR